MSDTPRVADVLKPEAMWLRPVRLVGEELLVYDAFRFPPNHWQGCELQLRRLQATGGLEDDGSHCLIDVLNEEELIVQDFRITKRAFDRLRRTWKFRRDRGNGI